MTVKQFNYEVGHRRHAFVGASYPGTLSVAVLAPHVPYVGDSWVARRIYGRLTTASATGTTTVAVYQVGPGLPGGETLMGTLSFNATDTSEIDITDVYLRDGDYFYANCTAIATTPGDDLVWWISEI